MKYKAAIFDMDGTVLDTIGDLTNAVTHAMKESGHSSDFTVEEVRHFFGSGAPVAFARALAFESGEDLETIRKIGTASPKDTPCHDREVRQEAFTSTEMTEEVHRLTEIFSKYYPDHCEELTRPFPGISEMLDHLHEAGVRLAVVSNKIDPAVQILAGNHFPGLFDFALGTTENLRRKPFPDMVNKCLEVLGVDREDAVYVGDSEIDIQTAEAAGMDCVSVTWGFRSTEFLHEHGAECIVRDPEELIRVIE